MVSTRKAFGTKVYDSHVFVHSFFLASEMLDPKAKSSGNLSSFAWMHKEQETKPSKPPMSTGITSVKTYARSQEQKNSTFINKNEHR